jgi:hypothetical protein
MWWLAIFGRCDAVEVAVADLWDCFPLFPRFYEFVRAGGRHCLEWSGYWYGSGRDPSYDSKQHFKKPKWRTVSGGREYGSTSEVRDPDGSTVSYSDSSLEAMPSGEDIGRYF